MNIVSLVLRIRPEHRAEVEAGLHTLPGVECHDMSPQGHLVVTVEDDDGARLADSLVAVHQVPQVLAVTLAYEHCDLQFAERLRTVQPTPSDTESMSSSACEEA
ncbi:chaperone NapD [Zoogloea sp.]|uniref:chaperone NapD n=1 Tax=Zoogloea sp. TaxID=49181 RepID=UPI0035B4F166|nr:chaperone NapD [Rhodocyclales bacterium]